MIDVIDEQPGQGNCLPAPNTTGRTLALFRHAADDVEDVRVVSPPEVDQIGPPGTLVVLEEDPLPLLVAGEVLPGHGQRVYLPAGEMGRQMWELVERMEGSGE